MRGARSAAGPSSSRVLPSCAPARMHPHDLLRRSPKPMHRVVVEPAQLGLDAFSSRPFDPSPASKPVLEACTGPGAAVPRSPVPGPVATMGAANPGYRPEVVIGPGSAPSRIAMPGPVATLGAAVPQIGGYRATPSPVGPRVPTVAAGWTLAVRRLPAPPRRPRSEGRPRERRFRRVARTGASRGDPDEPPLDPKTAETR